MTPTREQSIAARRNAFATHRFRYDGDPEDGNVMCMDCGCKPGHRVADQTCPGLAER